MTMKKNLLQSGGGWFRLAAVSLWAAVQLPAAAPANAGPVDDFAWVRGANYVPSYARNDVQTWMDFDPEVIGRELGYAQKLRLNCVRVFLQYAVYEQDPPRFLERFERLLQLCEQHQIRLLPVVFDSCFGEFPDLQKYRDQDWMASPGQNRLAEIYWPALEGYVRAVVGAHGSDRRIVMWDMMNEPTCTSYNQPEDQQLIWAFLRHFLAFTRRQTTLPLTVGVESSSLLGQVASQVDVLAFHNYQPGLREDIRQVRELGRKSGQAILINEVVMRPQQPYSLALPILREERIGWVFWELMFGKTQFTRGSSPIQGLVYPDGTCRDVREVALVAGVSLEEAAALFPPRPAPRQTEAGVVFTGFWTRWTGQGPRRERLFYSTSEADSATWDGAGGSAFLIHKAGPDCGIASIWIDGRPAPRPEVDTYSAQVDWNHRTRLAEGLAPGRHTFTVKPAGRKNAQASNCYLQVVDFESAP
jgi:hypothetical protein